MTTFEICDDIFSKINIKELKKELCPKAHEPMFSYQSKKEVERNLILPDVDPRKTVGYNRIIMTLKLLDKQYNTNFELKILKIIPVGYIRYCHTNSVISAKYINEKLDTNKWGSAKGFTFGVCKCGLSVIGEIHSVLKNKETGELYDITPDYVKTVKHHYFIESSYMTENYLYANGTAKRHLDLIVSLSQKDHDKKTMCSNHNKCNYKDFLKLL
jgi:hypothetical protein